MNSNKSSIRIPQSEEKISFIERCEKVDEYYKTGKESLNTEEMTRTCLKVDQDNQESIPIFTKCKTLEQMKIQSDLFTQQETQYTRQSIIHIQSMIHDNFEATIIMKFMKSISVIIKTQSTKFLIDKNPDLQEIYKKKVTRNPDISIEGYKKFVNCWDQVYNEKSTLSKDIIKQENLEANKNVEWQRLYYIIRKQHYEQELSKEALRKVEEQQRQKQLKEELIKQDKIRAKVLEMSKQIYQIKICKIKYPKTVLLTANENIITGKHNDSGYIPLNNNQQVYYLNNGHRIFQKFENIMQFCYLGGLNRNQEPDNTTSYDKHQLYTIVNENGVLYLGGVRDSLLHGYGELKLEQSSYKGLFANNMKHGRGLFQSKINGEEQQYEGNFDSDLKSGEFKSLGGTSYFHNDVPLNGPIQNQIIIRSNGETHVYQYEQNNNPNYTILHSNQISINNHQLKTLDFGKWLNQSIVDYYLEICKQYYQIDKSNIMFINTSEFQNIFGSILVPDYQISKDHIIKKDHGYSKIIIILNLDQCHFVSVVIEDQKIYLFDSLMSDRLLLINSIRNLFENGRTLEYNHKFVVSQQKNYYDCGVYSSYYVQQIMSQQQHSIENMSKELKFNVEQETINKFRVHIRKVILSEELPPFHN